MVTNHAGCWCPNGLPKVELKAFLTSGQLSHAVGGNLGLGALGLLAEAGNTAQSDLRTGWRKARNHVQRRRLLLALSQWTCSSRADLCVGFIGRTLSGGLPG